MSEGVDLLYSHENKTHCFSQVLEDWPCQGWLTCDILMKIKHTVFSQVLEYWPCQRWLICDILMKIKHTVFLRS